MRTTRIALASIAADAACILAFATVGRRNHGEPVTPAGVAETAWPFLAGAAVGWLVSRGWRRPTALPTGVAVWVGALAVGMLLRRLSSAGTAASFVLVATAVIGALLLGWRLAVRAWGRRADRRPRRNGPSDRPGAAGSR